MKTQPAWPDAHQEATSALINDLEAIFSHWHNVKQVGYGMHRAQGEKRPKSLKRRFQDERTFKFFA
jgi:hypothetical protein